MPARAIVTAVADAAERWTDADFPPRVRATAALEARLGYTMPVVDHALDRLFGGMTAAALTAAIAGEVGALGALDEFVAQPGRPLAWARGVDRVTIVAGERTIGAALVPLVYALCAKSRAIVRERGDMLVAPFAETLGEALPALRDAIEVQTWTEPSARGDDVALSAADVVVAFGDPAALRAIRAACSAEATFVPCVPSTNTAYVDRASLDGDLGPLTGAIARAASLDAAHVFFVERSDDDRHRRFVRALADACAAAAIEFPSGPGDPAPAGRIVVEAPDGEPPPLRAGTLALIVVGGPADAAAYLRRHALRVGAVGIPVEFRADAAEDLAARFGAVRVAPLDALPAPPLGGHHGGRARIADFVRWVDRE